MDSSTMATTPTNTSTATGTTRRSARRVCPSIFTAVPATYGYATTAPTNVGIVTWFGKHTAAMHHHRRPEEVASP